MVNAVKIAGDATRFSQDETGQWWYRFGVKRPTRTRVYPKVCPKCEETFLANSSRVRGSLRYCSRACGISHSWHREGSKHGRGELSTRWLGGRRLNKSGYVIVFTPDHPRCQGNKRKYVQEHILVMEKMLGRYLRDDERVHHKNGVRHDNRPENLELWQGAQPSGVRYDERRHCATCTCFGGST